jgi:hypothetical protein
MIKRLIAAFSEFIRGIEARHAGVYRATDAELKAIDEAEVSGIATDAEVEATFRQFRPLSEN